MELLKSLKERRKAAKAKTEVKEKVEEIKEPIIPVEESKEESTKLSEDDYKKYLEVINDKQAPEKEKEPKQFSIDEYFNKRSKKKEIKDVKKQESEIAKEPIIKKEEQKKEEVTTEKAAISYEDIRKTMYTI